MLVGLFRVASNHALAVPELSMVRTRALVMTPLVTVWLTLAALLPDSVFWRVQVVPSALLSAW